MRLLLPLSLLSLLLSPLCASAGGGAFTSEVALDAVEQPESKQVVFRVEPNTSYPLLKKGGPGRAWCKLRGASAEGWVRCEGAQETAVSPAPTAAVLVEADRRRGQQAQALPVSYTPAQGCASTCTHRPLFDKAPELTAVDRQVLDMCPARPDAAVSAGDVKRFFSTHYEDARIQRALAAAGRARQGARQDNVEWLAGLWVSTGPRNAFTHVFCGDDWTRGPIGGLHFLPRYAQLEAQGKLCYDGPARGGGAKKGDNYLIRFRGVAPWSCGVKKVGGFSRTPDAVGLAAIGTRAFVRCCARGGAKKEGGVYAAPDLGGTAWRIFCGTRNGTYGIATLYPTDERPTCAE